MSVEKVSETREINGFIVTVARNGPMGVIASNIIAREVKEFLDRIEEVES